MDKFLMESVEALRREVARLNALVESKDHTIKELVDTFGKDKKTKSIITKIINSHKITKS